LNTLFEHITPDELADVTDEKIQEIVKTLRESKNDEKVRRFLNVTEKFFEFLIAANIRETNPMYTVTIRSDRHCDPRKCAKAMLAYPWGDDFQGHRDAAIVALACYTYIRLSDFPKLKLRNLDTRGTRIRYGDKYTVPLPAPAFDLIAKYAAYSILHKSAKQDSPLFTTRDGAALSRAAINKALITVMNKLGGRTAACNPNHLRGCMLHNEQSFELD
jgi:site-specific recombinase XerD